VQTLADSAATALDFRMAALPKSSTAVGKEWFNDVSFVGDSLTQGMQLYEEGIVKKPIPSSEYIHDFLDQGLENAWVYYCCGQGYRVSNRFIAMPAWRTRILGVQLYKYNMEGFLHWGFTS